MDNYKRKLYRRLMVLCAAAACCGVLCAANLFSLEIIHGDEYEEQADRQYSYTRTVAASRGEIKDRNGETLSSNTTMYAVTIDYTMWDVDNQNATILKLTKMIRSDSSAQLNNSLPINRSNGSYVFSQGKQSSDYQDLMSFCSDQGWGDELDAPAVMEHLCELFSISDDYSANQKIRVARVRYQMEREQFSAYNPYTLATNISIDLVTKISEQHDSFSGVEVETKSDRVVNTSIAGNIIGYTGPIYEEDWATYKEAGYSIDSEVGKTGAEQAFEEYLHGTDGERTIQTDSKGNVISEETSSDPQSGSSIELTIDLGLQSVAESSLASRCQSISGAEGGAAVVIDVNSGEILAMANYPTYNLQTFNQDYDSLNADELSPLLNRCVASAYAPGSTYKICTAVAGLEEGVIDASTQIYDSGIYTYYSDYQPRCWYYNTYGTGHGYEDVVGAIEDSCNYFFFETGRLLGGKNLEKYAKKFGLGEYTGIELSGEQTGIVSGPTERAEAVENGTAEPWTDGDVLQAAIGQGDNEFTPVQLANYCATIANGGTLYSAHLLKQVTNYDGTETVSTQEPEVLDTIDASDETWDLVHEGMSKVTGEDGTAAEVFQNYSIAVAGKSGTAQRNSWQQDNGLFISYAPYDNPEIAVCVVIEGGDSGNNVAPVVRDIYDYYFYGEDGSGQTTDTQQTDGTTEESGTTDSTTEETDGNTTLGSQIAGWVSSVFNR